METPWRMTRREGAKLVHAPYVGLSHRAHQINIFKELTPLETCLRQDECYAQQVGKRQKLRALKSER